MVWVAHRFGARERALLATGSLLLAVASLMTGPAFAQGQFGDAAFCRQYAAVAATAAEDAIKLNPGCLSYNNGVHGDRQMHIEWCSRTASDKVEGAAVHIRRLASRCTQGRLAEATEYGGYDVVGNERFERDYGSARGWTVRAASSGRTFMYCVAVRTGDRPVRLGWDLSMPGESGQWQLAVPIRSKKDWEGSLHVDGKGLGTGGATVSGSVAGDWTVAWLGAGHVEALRDGRNAVLGIGTLNYAFGLDGAAAAILKVDECRQRKGVAP